MTSKPAEPTPAIGYLNKALHAPPGERANLDAHSLDYQARDYEVVDYRMFELPELPGIKIRGPAFDPHAGDNYFTVMGAAQAFGTYVPRAFPDILSETVGLQALNLALGTAGPRFYAARDKLIDLANGGRFLILQVMSARSEPNSRFESVGTIEMLCDTKTGALVNAAQAWDRIMKEEPENARRYVAETRASWVGHCRAIVEKMKVPVILLWISNRSKGDPVDCAATAPGEFMGGFPQIVDDDSVQRVAELCDAYVECGHDRNAGHKLISRFTGKQTEVDFGLLTGRPSGSTDGGWKESVNTYYPSPEQHDDTAALLLPAIAKLGPREGLRQ